MLEKFPFTNFHDLNLDWIIKRLETLEALGKKIAEYAASAKQDAENALQSQRIASAGATVASEAAVEARQSVRDMEDTVAGAIQAADDAAASAENAASSATRANNRATDAANSANSASTNAGNASTYATNAANSATAAGNSATAAHNSELAAAASATTAANSASLFTWTTLVNGTGYKATVADTYERTPITFTPSRASIICVHCKYSGAAVRGLLVTRTGQNRSDAIAMIETATSGGLELFMKAAANTTYDVWVKFSNNSGTNSVYVYSIG